MAIDVPAEPTVDSGLAATQKYLEYIQSQSRPLEVRRLIGFWGRKGRGKNAVRLIDYDLARMGLRTEPPFDSGPLDGYVFIQSKANDAENTASSHQPEDHLLTLSRIDSASFALQVRADGSRAPGFVSKDTSIANAATIMLRNDYSQLPVVETIADREIVGVFTWESYAQIRLRGDSPETVGGAVLSTTAVDLHSDLFASVGPIADHGFVLVTYRGALAGIVTASDLTREFEELALPFLAIGRCEQELRRVARGKLAAAILKHKKNFDEFTFGDLQHLFKNNWDALGWSLSSDEFIGWVDQARRLRNSIAHFDNQDQDPSTEVEAVHGLTKWLMAVTAPVDGDLAITGSDDLSQGATSKERIDG